MRDVTAPDWLPDLIPFSGDWSSYVEKIHAAFFGDFFSHRVQFRGRPVNVRRDPRDQGKEAGFWHAVSEGKDELERTPDLRRCERVRWIRAIIEHPVIQNVCVWEEMRGSDRRIQLALTDFSYLVVLADRRSYVQFITAFCVEHERQRQKKKEAWKRAQKS
ncbi:MAG: hypothetical protein M0R80_30615 [Proteobacteria bacterium]|nr:hypothetical protein [Pseudomonadota bacterium]